MDEWRERRFRCVKGERCATWSQPIPQLGESDRKRSSLSSRSYRHSPTPDQASGAVGRHRLRTGPPSCPHCSGEVAGSRRYGRLLDLGTSCELDLRELPPAAQHRQDGQSCGRQSDGAQPRVPYPRLRATERIWAYQTKSAFSHCVGVAPQRLARNRLPLRLPTDPSYETAALGRRCNFDEAASAQ